MKKIQTVSRLLHFLFLAIVFIAPLLTVLFWLFFNYMPINFVVENVPVMTFPVIFLPAQKILAILISFLPIGVVMFGSLTLAKLFKNFEKGAIFIKANVAYCKKVGYAVSLWVIASWVYDLFISYILNMHNPMIPYQQQKLEIVIRGSDIALLIISCMIIIIAWVMNEGYQIFEENKYTI